MTDDVMFEVAEGLRALTVIIKRHSVVALEVKVTLRDQLSKSRLAVTRSRTLLDELNARKPPSFL